MKISEKQLLCLLMIVKDTLQIAGDLGLSQNRRSELLNEIVNQQDETLMVIEPDYENVIGRD